jgi:RNA polymerase sigma-70 factor (ECF subfamily)
VPPGQAPPADLAAIERDIASRLARGDLDGAATVGLRGYGPAIVGYFTLMTGGEEAAYEAFAQFGEELWKSIGSYRGESSFKTWAYALAYRVVIHLRRDKARRPSPRRLRTTEMSKIAAEVWSTALDYQKVATKDRLDRIRERLDPDEQTLITLRFDRDFSWSEVAEVLSQPDQPIDEATVRKRFSRLRRKLRAMAEDIGL